MRKFVWAYVTQTGGNAHRAIGLAGFSTFNADTIKSRVWDLMHREDVLAAIHEESWRALHSLVPNAIAAASILNDPMHKDYRKAANDVLDRSGFALPTEHRVIVEKHGKVSTLQEAGLSELKRLAVRAGLDPVSLTRLPAPPSGEVEDAEFVDVTASTAGLEDML
jgi:lambda repressor-like predicted transcriptional regulator